MFFEVLFFSDCAFTPNTYAQVSNYYVIIKEEAAWAWPAFTFNNDRQ